MSGSGEDDDILNADPESTSLWLVFGACVAVALGFGVLYQCRRPPSAELTEGLVKLHLEKENDLDELDEDGEVFGKLDSKV